MRYTRMGGVAFTMMVLGMGSLEAGKTSRIEVLNGGFEAELKDWDANKDRGGAEGEMTVSSEEKHTGENSLKFSMPTKVGRLGVMQRKTMVVNPGDKFRVSFWAKVKQEMIGGSYPGVISRIHWTDSDSKDIEPLPHILFDTEPQLGASAYYKASQKKGKKLPEDWYQVTGEVVAPEGANGMRIYLMVIERSGEFWVDDVTVEKIE